MSVIMAEAGFLSDISPRGSATFHRLKAPYDVRAWFEVPAAERWVWAQIEAEYQAQYPGELDPNTGRLRAPPAEPHRSTPVAREAPA